MCNQEKTKRLARRVSLALLDATTTPDGLGVQATDLAKVQAQEKVSVPMFWEAINKAVEYGAIVFDGRSAFHITAYGMVRKHQLLAQATP